MRSILGLGKVCVLLTLLMVLFNQSAYAQTARKLNKKIVTVRLCPATCKSVNGHGLKPGGNVTVLESRNGWVRVSPYLNRKTLVSAFGNKITKKPALWVSAANLASSETKTTETDKKEPKAAAKKKPATVSEQIARLRRIPTPVFRPDGAVQQASEETQQPVEEAKVEEPKPEEPKPEEPKVEEPKVETAEIEEATEKPVVVDTKPVTAIAKGSTSKKALTWEEVQAKIAAQGGQTNNRTIVKAEEAETIKVETPEVQEEPPTVKTEPAPKKEEQVAAVDTPKISQEPKNTAAVADPIAFGERPKKMTKTLLDKRLNKLPGTKSKVKREVVIALRHYALGLLNSGACKGIAGGGASAAPGMLFIACSEDPTYLRQFPLKEATW